MAHQQAGSRSRVAASTGLRGLAASSVVVFHFLRIVPAYGAFVLPVAALAERRLCEQP